MASSSSDEVVLYEARDGVATLTLNRPDRLNAWTTELEARYFGLPESCDGDPEVRVIIVTGAGKGFCAGADMDMLRGIGSGSAPVHSRKPQTYPLTIRKPILAAINGACAGLGLVHALMCDLRFAAAGAKLTTAFVRRGLIAEHGISWVLPRVVGPSRALDLLLSGRVVLAEEALGMGLVDRVVAPQELLDTVTAYARDLAANCSPTSMAAIKHQVYRHYETDLAAALRESNELMVASLKRPDFKEGVASFVERRPPRFAPLAKS
jgi:enoyl-CoA hydratase/carnithine racemase